jgi:uncharacterized protein
MKQKIILDTNVVVSGLIQRNYPNFILYELFFEDKIQLCISEELMLEYYEVLARTKFSKYQDFFIKAESLLADIELKSKKYYPKIKLEIITDKKDNMILELADECNADFIITGNTNDFTFLNYKQTKIVTPNEYWENYLPV